jgi:transcriptional/translational regulatory protein YebC/TACO1
MAEVDVTDVERQGEQTLVFAPSTEYAKTKQAILEAYPETQLTVDEISFIPQSNHEIPVDDVPMFEKFMGMLNDCDDVQDIYHNGVLPSS